MATLDNQFVSSLTGKTINMNEFNDVNKFNEFDNNTLFPSIKGDLPINVESSNRLTELNGINPYSTKKVETEPFFDPKNNMSNVRAKNPFVSKEKNGNKNNLYKDREFYENRTNSLQSRFRNKEVPFDQIKVGKAKLFNIGDYLEYVKDKQGGMASIPTKDGMNLLNEFFKIAERNKLPPYQKHIYDILITYKQKEEHFQTALKEMRLNQPYMTDDDRGEKYHCATISIAKNEAVSTMLLEPEALVFLNYLLDESHYG